MKRGLIPCSMVTVALLSFAAYADDSSSDPGVDLKDALQSDETPEEIDGSEMSELSAREAAAQAATDSEDEAERAEYAAGKDATPLSDDGARDGLKESVADELLYEAESIEDEKEIDYEPPAAASRDAVEGEVIVTFSKCSVPEKTSLGEVTLGLSLAIDECSGLYTFSDRLSVDEAVEAILGDKLVDDAEGNYPVVAYAAANDTNYGDQWNFSQVGAAAAWDYATGDTVTVAVVDSGVTEGGTDGLSNVVAGWDFIDNDSNPADPNGHGSHVAATIAQTTNNSTLWAGLSHGVDIMPVRVLGAGGGGTAAGVAAGINWAVANGADVINLSLGGAVGAGVMQTAVENAAAAGVIVVAATGNDGGAVGFPAAYPDAIAVSATDKNMAVTSYSNTGAQVDIAAPGGTSSKPIRQETGEGNDVGKYGTSMASPHVAAGAALLLSTGMDPADVEGQLTTWAIDIEAAGWDQDSGAGLMHIGLAVSDAASPWNFETGTGTGTIHWWNLGVDDHYLSGDFDGDGTDDFLALNDPWSHLMTYNGSGWDFEWGTGSGSIYWWNMADDDRYLAGDFDGDGADDLLAINDPWSHMMTYNGSSFVYEWGTGSGSIHWWNMADDDEYVVGDFDGDGSDELLAINDPWVHHMEYNGSGWDYLWGTSSGSIHWWNLGPNDEYVVGDFDGDGSDELLAISDPWVHLMEFDGSSWSYAWGTSSGSIYWWNLGSGDQFVTGDYDNDGADELLALNAPWVHMMDYNGSSFTYQSGVGGGLLAWWFLNDADTYLSGDFDSGNGGAELMAIKDPWMHLMTYEN